jgi:hypothetical protein
MMAHSYNPNYCRGRGRRIAEPGQSISLSKSMRTFLKNKLEAEELGYVSIVTELT